jgi:hypothetical protein
MEGAVETAQAGRALGGIQFLEEDRQLHFYSRVRDRRQMTLNEEVSDALALHIGDLLVCKVIGIRRAKVRSR